MTPVQPQPPEFIQLKIQTLQEATKLPADICEQIISYDDPADAKFPFLDPIFLQSSI